jgi:hypothetical protein
MNNQILIAINQLKLWAKSNYTHPKKTSFHAAALLYRGCLLINQKKGGIIACVNSKTMCAERNLLVLCDRYRIKEV